MNLPQTKALSRGARSAPAGRRPPSAGCISALCTDSRRPGPSSPPCSAPGETEPQVQPTTQGAGESTGFGLGFRVPLSALSLSPCPRRPLEFTWRCGSAGVGSDHVRTQASGLPDQQPQSTCWEHSPHPWGQRHPSGGGRPHSVCPTARTARSTRPRDSLGRGPSARLGGSAPASPRAISPLPAVEASLYAARALGRVGSGCAQPSSEPGGGICQPSSHGPP